MNPRSSFVRKVIYVCLIAALLVPLSLLSRPANKSDGSGGGTLAELRREAEISEASLGEIDPTAESVKLVLFGLRGPATTILWQQAHEQQKKKRWDDLRATFDELSKLQPHFGSVWRHQAWNISYNISAEWDDYRERYRNVKDGIKFLYDGHSKNKREGRIVWDIGWFTSHKIGNSDEKLEFRRLFAKTDDDLYDYLNERLPYGDVRDIRNRRDNWLMGKSWYRAGERMVDEGDATIGAMGDFNFFVSSTMAQINYADAIESEGKFDDDGRDAIEAWREAGEDLNRFGNRDMAIAADLKVHINDLEVNHERLDKVLAELDALQPGLRKELEQQKIDDQPDDVRAAFAVPLDQRTDEQHGLVYTAQAAVYVSDEEVAAALPAEKRKDGERLAKDALTLRGIMREIEILRTHTNFEYWRERAKMETLQDTVNARRFAYLGDDAVKKGNLVQAKQHYADSLELWKKVFAIHPKMAEDGTVGDDAADLIRRYQSDVLDRLTEELPEDPVFKQLLERFPED